MQKFLFLDRDGVINEDVGYAHKEKDIILIKGVIKLIERAFSSNFSVGIVTNQSGIGRGYFTEQQFHSIMEYIVNLLNNNGMTMFNHISYYFCPHLPSDKCKCRKPAEGLFRECQSSQCMAIDWANSIMVGDNLTDLIPASKMGINRLYLFNRQKNLTYFHYDGDLPHFSEISDLNHVLI